MNEYTERARKVLQLANQEAQRFNHEYIGAEHILIGLVKEGTGVGCNVIKNLGQQLGKIRLETEKLLQSGPDMITMGKLPMTSRAKQVMEIALEEQRDFKHNFLGTEHLLLALLTVEGSVAFDVFRKCGIELEQAREEVLNLLGSGLDSEEGQPSSRIAQQESVNQRKSRNSEQKKKRRERSKKLRARKKLKSSMYERFTDRARRVMQLANQEAQRFNHEYIGTEHILLGLVKEGSGVACNVLTNLEVELREVRLEVEKLVQREPEMITMGKLPQTPRAKKLLEYAMEEARDLDHSFIGTEHLLLGLLRQSEGTAAQVLEALGLNQDEVRVEVLNLLGGDAELVYVKEARVRKLPTALRNLEKVDLIELNRYFLRSVDLDINTLNKLHVVLAQVNRNNVFLIGPQWLANEYFGKLGAGVIDETIPVPLAPINFFQVDTSIYSAQFLKACLGAINSGTRSAFCFYLRRPHDRDESASDCLNRSGAFIESDVVSFIVGGTEDQWNLFKSESPALAKSFTVVKLDSLSETSISSIVSSGSKDLETQHAVVIESDSVTEAIKLAAELDIQMEIPDSANRILDYAAANKVLFSPASESDEILELRQDFQMQLTELGSVLKQGEYKLAKSLHEGLEGIRADIIAASPESDSPIVKPEDVRRAFEAMSS